MDPHSSLQVFQILGDYARNGRPLPKTHPLVKRVEQRLGDNSSLLLLHMDETVHQLDDLERSYTAVKASKFQDAYGLHLGFLPRFCRLHSVIHGLHAWCKLSNHTMSGDKTADRLRTLMTGSSSLLFTFAEHGLTLATALEILVPAGREIIDPELRCYSSLPHNSAEGLRMSPSEYRPGIPHCFAENRTSQFPPPG